MNPEQVRKIVSNLVVITKELQRELTFDLPTFRQNERGDVIPSTLKYPIFRFEQIQRLKQKPIPRLVAYAEQEEKFQEVIQKKIYKFNILKTKVFHQASLLDTLLEKNGTELQTTEN